MTTGTQMTPLLCVDSLGIQWCSVSTAVLTLVLVRVQFGFMICGAVVKRKVSLTVGIEALGNTTMSVVTMRMQGWPVPVVRLITLTNSTCTLYTLAHILC